MIDRKDFSRIRKELEKVDAEREKLIADSRLIQRDSKHAIYSIHRGEMAEAKRLIDSAKKAITKSKRNIAGVCRLNLVGAFSAATEEYVEAACFYGVVAEKRLLTSKELGVDNEIYLQGLCDMTGELARRAVLLATKGKDEEVVGIRDTIDAIAGLMSQLNLRNGELRKKSDSIKWNLKKVEDIVYDMKVRRR